jgi:hypothetical protein
MFLLATNLGKQEKKRLDQRCPIRVVGQSSDGRVQGMLGWWQCYQKCASPNTELAMAQAAPKSLRQQETSPQAAMP